MNEANSLKEMAMRLRSLKAAKNNLETALKQINKDLEQLTKVDLVDEMNRLEMDEATISDVGTLTVVGDVYVAIPAANRELAREWLDDNGHGDLITETINGSTLKAWVKERMKKGEKLPEDVFKITPYEFVKIK